MDRKKTDVWVKQIGQNRGAPRIWLDGIQAIRAGFAPGDKYDLEVDGDRVVLTINQDGSRTVSTKKKGERLLPVVDINSKELLRAFQGMEAIRVVVQKGRVFLLPLASELQIRERRQRLINKLASNEPLKMGSLSHGGGVLSRAIHEGLVKAGVKAEMAFANEIREDLLSHAIEHNDVWGDETEALAVPVQELVQDEWLMQRLPKLEVLEMGLPCSGASSAGKAKRGLSMMEDHPEIGHLVFAALAVINRVQPTILQLENVVNYSKTASAQILRHQLRDMGYTVHEAVLEGKDWGILENRVRWCLVATTRGIEFDFDKIAPAVKVVKKLGDYLEDIPEDDPRWSEMRGLKEKEVRDAELGRNFKMQVFNAESTHIGTLTKGMQKNRSTDPKIAHPTNPDLLRIPTAREHAAIKRIPQSLIEGLSETTAHELLGQSIVYDPFVSVGERIAESIMAVMEEIGIPIEPAESIDTPAPKLAARTRSYGVG